MHISRITKKSKTTFLRTEKYRFMNHGKNKYSFMLHAKQKCPFTCHEKSIGNPLLWLEYFFGIFHSMCFLMIAQIDQVFRHLITSPHQDSIRLRRTKIMLPKAISTLQQKERIVFFHRNIPTTWQLAKTKETTTNARGHVHVIITC